MFGGYPGELCPPKVKPDSQPGSRSTSARTRGSATTCLRVARTSGSSSGAPQAAVRAAKRAKGSSLASSAGRGSLGSSESQASCFVALLLSPGPAA